MNYHGEKYCLLDNGKIENLYYNVFEDDKPNPELRMGFYRENGVWYLDHDEATVKNIDGKKHVTITKRHDKIIRFGNTKEELEK